MQVALVLMHSQVALSGATVNVHVKPGCQSTSVAVSKLTIISSLISKQAFVKSITKLKCFGEKRHQVTVNALNSAR